MTAARPVPDAPRCTLAESPRWHDGRWWWVDVPGGGVYAAEDDGRRWMVERRLAAGHRVSVLHPAGPGQVLVANGPRLELWTTDGPARLVRTVMEIELPSGCVLNDATADPWGRLWIGVVDPVPSSGNGHLLCVAGAGRARAAAGTVRMPNGLALDPGGGTLFHADSGDQVVLRYAVSAAGIGRRAVYLRIADGLPDGLASDVAGGLWVAVYGTGEVRRYDRTGALDAVVTVPTPQVTSVALGGPDGRDMLITTAQEGYDPARSRAEPLAGRLFRARVRHAGTPLFPAKLF